MRTKVFATTRGVLAALVVTALAAAPQALSAQSQLDVSQARAFLGNWVISMQTDFGPMTLNMTIADQGGKVAASVGSPEMGGMVNVTDVTRDGDALVLRYDIDAQGQMIDVMMSLTPSGENLATYIEAAAGQFMVQATATRAAS
jgi:hypothetical protein